MSDLKAISDLNLTNNSSSNNSFLLENDYKTLNYIKRSFTTTPTSIANKFSNISLSLKQNNYSEWYNYLLRNSTPIHVYLCTVLVVIGVIGNIISLIIFIRSAKYSPKITTRHSFILLSLSNLVYLLVFWYFSVFPKTLHYFQINNNIAANISLVNSNVYVCKSIFYSLNVSICINALITVNH
jgi:hypothetical protein